MCEKIRALLGQRIYAVARDVYDVFSLMGSVDEQKVTAALPAKIDARGVPDAGLTRMLERRYEFRAHWQRDLAALLPRSPEHDFDQVWACVTDYVGRVVDQATCGLSRRRNRRSEPGVQ